MSESSRDLLETRKRVLGVVSLTNMEFDIAIQPDWIHLIPLVEAVPQLLTVSKMVGEYVAGCRRLCGRKIMAASIPTSAFEDTLMQLIREILKGSDVHPSDRPYLL